MTEVGILNSRLLIAALAATCAVTFAAPVAAEPTTAPAEQTEQPADNSAEKPAEVLLASSEIRTSGQQSDGQASPPAKRPRAARVTTCRCAGQITPPQQP